MANVTAASSRYPKALLNALIFEFDNASGADAARRIIAVDNVCAQAQFRHLRHLATLCAAGLTQ